MVNLWRQWIEGRARSILDRMPDTIFDQEAFGASRVAWGSNFPNSVGTLSEILGAARKAFSFAKASDQDWIFGKTALTLYPALAD